MWICATESKEKKKYGERHPRKDEILKFMTSHEAIGMTTEPVYDDITGEKKAFKDNGYKVGNLYYSNSDIYHFSRYNMQLNPEFCEKVLEEIEKRKEG